MGGQSMSGCSRTGIGAQCFLNRIEVQQVDMAIETQGQQRPRDGFR